MTPTWKGRFKRWLDWLLPDANKQELVTPAPTITLRERIERCERLSEEAQQHAEQAAYHIGTPAGKLPARKLAEVCRLLYADALMVWALTKDP